MISSIKNKIIIFLIISTITIIFIKQEVNANNKTSEAPCGENEIKSICGCDGNCNKTTKICPKGTKTCVSLLTESKRCLCKATYVRGNDGKCIKQKDCPK
ncbi:hypothetical protein Mgra_00009115 [Meloidogyne graminicola]|uniref:TIL domain-containing protein n=1 Tax=Meloidogyne graminicola TaxID=189291 RepID=A0A8S9ZDT7_9BILA|nr:hypothetical protein Mgra_00009115 [Meloidogyne graminicola]